MLPSTLTDLTGTWTGEETLSPSPWSPGGTALGHHTFTPALGDTALLHDYTQERDGAVTLTGHGIWLPDGVIASAASGEAASDGDGAQGHGAAKTGGDGARGHGAAETGGDGARGHGAAETGGDGALAWFWFDSYGFVPAGPSRGATPAAMEKTTPRGTQRARFAIGDDGALHHAIAVRLADATDFTPVVSARYTRV
jgi:hypothetical protein